MALETDPEDVEMCCPTTLISIKFIIVSPRKRKNPPKCLEHKNK